MLGPIWKITCVMLRIFSYCNQFRLLATRLYCKGQTSVKPTQKSGMDKTGCATPMSHAKPIISSERPWLISGEKHTASHLWNQFDLHIWWITYPYFWCGHLMCSQTCKWSSRSWLIFTELCSNQYLYMHWYTYRAHDQNKYQWMKWKRTTATAISSEKVKIDPAITSSKTS